MAAERIKQAMNEQYEMTKEDYEDRNKYKDKAKRFAIIGVICIPLSFIYDILIIVALVLLIIALINFLKMRKRTPEFYEKKEKARIERAEIIYKNVPQKFKPFKDLIQKVRTKCRKYGFDIFEIPTEDFDNDDLFRANVFFDYQYYKERGEEYRVYIAWYKGYFIITYMNIFSLLAGNIGFKLADENGLYEGIADNMDLLFQEMKTFHYAYDRRREGGFALVTPTQNVEISSVNDEMGRLTIRTDIGIEKIDLYMPTYKEYEEFRDLMP